MTRFLSMVLTSMDVSVIYGGVVFPVVVVAELGRVGARAVGEPAGRHPGRRRRAARRRRRLGAARRTRHLRFHGR